MRRVSDWRSQDNASDFETHDRADLAQEFLCRNPRYERDLADTAALIEASPAQQTSEWEGLARRWGLCFRLRGRPVANPASRALVVRDAPSVVILDTPCIDASPVIDAILQRSVAILSDITASDGRHLVIADRLRRHRLWIRSDPALEAEAFETPADQTNGLRLGATLQFHRWLHGSGPQLLRPLLVPTPYQRQRLVQLFRIADAVADGADLRDIA